MKRRERRECRGAGDAATAAAAAATDNDDAAADVDDHDVDTEDDETGVACIDFTMGELLLSTLLLSILSILWLACSAACAPALNAIRRATERRHVCNSHVLHSCCCQRHANGEKKPSQPMLGSARGQTTAERASDKHV
jgi:hypothetical protein